VAYGGLNARNLLIDENFNIKFTDFSNSKYVKENETARDGLHCTMSPEKFEGKEYNSADEDFYSLANLLFYLKVGAYPSNKQLKFYTDPDEKEQVEMKTSKNDMLIKSNKIATLFLRHLMTRFEKHGEKVGKIT